MTRVNKMTRTVQNKQLKKKTRMAFFVDQIDNLVQIQHYWLSGVNSGKKEIGHIQPKICSFPPLPRKIPPSRLPPPALRWYY